MGLPSEHVDRLLALVQVSKIRQPFLVFSNSVVLDDVLRRGLYLIDGTRNIAEEERERQKAVLYEIKQVLESQPKRTAGASTTRFLKTGQKVSITPEGGKPLSSRIISNMSDFLSLAAPVADSTSRRWPRGTKISVYFWRENDAGYSFASKVLGYESVRGVPCVLIQHGKALRREQRRRNRRRQIHRACFFYPISVTETGGRPGQKKAAILTNLKALGTVVDLSAGGCAIQSVTPFDPGTLIMVEFDIDRKVPIRSFGKVQRARRLSGRGGIMHVMFTRVSREYLNRIRAFVYDFTTTETPAQWDHNAESPRRFPRAR